MHSCRHFATIYLMPNHSETFRKSKMTVKKHQELWRDDMVRPSFHSPEDSGHRHGNGLAFRISGSFDISKLPGWESCWTNSLVVGDLTRHNTNVTSLWWIMTHSWNSTAGRINVRAWLPDMLVMVKMADIDINTFRYSYVIMNGWCLKPPVSRLFTELFS